jgi:alpha-beta hydrolase superfamily lysophospholipase
VRRFSDYVDDLFAVLDHFAESQPFREAGKPIAFGHSLGGLITLQASLARKDAFRGLALCSPYLGLALRPAAWQLYAGRALAKIWPTFSQPTGITGAQLTHDRQRAAAIDSDPLRIRRMTAALFTEVETAQANTLARAGELTSALYCRASGQDSIVALAATQALFERYGGREKTLHVAKEDFHELLQELDWRAHADAFAEQFSSWAATPR